MLGAKARINHWACCSILRHHPEIIDEKTFRDGRYTQFGNTGSSRRPVAVLIGTFASVVTLTTVMWLIQSGRLVFP